MEGFLDRAEFEIKSDGMTFPEALCSFLCDLRSHRAGFCQASMVERGTE